MHDQSSSTGDVANPLEVSPEEEESIRERADPPAQESRYHIELSPGNWVTTTSEAEARELLVRQKELEDSYPIAYYEGERDRGDLGKPGRLHSLEEDAGDDQGVKSRQVLSGVQEEFQAEERGVVADGVEEIYKEEEEEEDPDSILHDSVREGSNQVEEREERTDEEPPDGKRRAFRSRISKCVFNPRECRFK